MDDGAVNDLETLGASSVVFQKLWMTHVLSVSERGHSPVYGQSWRRPWGQTAFWSGFHHDPRLGCEGVTEKTIKEIVLVRS